MIASAILLNNIITILICLSAVIVAYIAIVSRNKSFNQRIPVTPFADLAPGLVVTIGILGTFVGIYLGLMNFNTSDINQSIPELLEGLKTAFITSIVGMICAIILRGHYSNIEKKESSTSDKTSNDPIRIMINIDSNISIISRSIGEIHDTLNRVFKSDEEYSLISQVKILRTDINDLKRDIIRSLNDFGEKIAELGTEAMIKALREVIEQFNARLNDLVGAEFKQLKEAMLKLVDWQNNYKYQVDNMQAQLNDFLDEARKTSTILKEIEKSCTKIGQSMDSIDSSLSAISVSAEDIDEHIKCLNMQNKALADSIEKIRDIGEQAKNVVPSITKSIDQLIVNMSKAIDANMEILKQTINTNISSVKQMNEEYRKYAIENTRQVQESLKEFKNDLQEALVESLKSLSGQMVAISNKFAEDYTPLAEKLRDVMRIAEGIKDYDKNKLQ